MSKNPNITNPSTVCNEARTLSDDSAKASPVLAKITPTERCLIETSIESLILLLDEIDWDPDFEESGDDERSLGWTTDADQISAIAKVWDDEDREDEHDGRESEYG